MEISLRNCPKKSVDGISILVVDDDTACLSIVAAILKKFKYEVVTVKHANDALCTLRIKGGAFDLVVSDVHMPDMDGFQLQQAITQEFNLPVVLMSADDKEGVALKGLESGAAFFIYKPVSPDDVRDLWQFAAMKKNKSGVVIEENFTEEKNETTISVSSSSLNGDRSSNKGSNRINPKNGGSGERKGETSQKKHKIIWTNSLHNRFLEAIRSIGLDRAVPKKILEVMNVPGLTRENVASHLQKYRIFLRRVSDASYKIQFSADKRLSKNLFRSSLEPFPTSPSTLVPNKFNKFPYQKTGLFPYYNTPLPNPVSYSSSTLITPPGFGQPRLHSNKVNDFGLKLNINNTDDLIYRNDRPCVKLTQTNSHNRQSTKGYIPNISLDDVSSTLSISYKNINGTSSSMYQPNYVGYSISSIKHLAGSGHSDSSNSAINLANEEFPSDSNNMSNANIASIVDDHLAQNMGACDNNSNDFVIENVNGAGEELSNVIANYRVSHIPSSLHLHREVEKGGENHESGYSPLFDMFELDAMSTRQEPLEEGHFDTTLAHQVNSQNHAQQNGGEILSNFYGDMSHWNNCNPSFGQDPNQHQQQQILEDLTNSDLILESSSQLLSKTLAPPIQHEDDFMESLFASFGEDHILGGI